MEEEKQGRSPFGVALVAALFATLTLGWYVTAGPGGWGSSAVASPAVTASQVSLTNAGSPDYAQPTAVSTAVPAGIAADSWAPTLAGTPTFATDAEAISELKSQSASDKTQVPFNGQWVAQLASKYVGIVDPIQTAANGTHTFRGADILAEHMQIESSVTDATVVLLNSKDFGAHRNYRGEPYWQTVAYTPNFDSEDTVLSWCADQFPNLSGNDLNNHCLPARLGG